MAIEPKAPPGRSFSQSLLAHRLFDAPNAGICSLLMGPDFCHVHRLAIIMEQENTPLTRSVGDGAPNEVLESALVPEPAADGAVFPVASEQVLEPRSCRLGRRWTRRSDLPEKDVNIRILVAPFTRVLGVCRGEVSLERRVGACLVRHNACDSRGCGWLSHVPWTGQPVPVIENLQRTESRKIAGCPASASSAR